MTEEVKAPERIWVHPWIGARMFSLTPMPEYVPYVPKTEVDHVWEKAIAVVSGTLAPYQYRTQLSGRIVRKTLIAALERARDESLSADKEVEP